MASERKKAGRVGASLVDARAPASGAATPASAAKRLIAVVTVKDGRVVKSYGYASWRPAGDLITALKNLDRWAADEIVVLDISRRDRLDQAVLRQIAAAKVTTPLAYGGGIRSAEDLNRLMDLGCDRFVIESVLYDEAETLAKLADLAGHQALIGAVPLFSTPDGWAVWRPVPGHGMAPPAGDQAALQAFLARQPVSEFLLTSVDAEGRAGYFPVELLDAFADLPAASAIWFGGLDAELAAACLRQPVTAAVAFGNPLHETELALPHLREALLAAAGERALRSVRTIAS